MFLVPMLPLADGRICKLSAVARFAIYMFLVPMSPLAGGRVLPFAENELKLSLSMKRETIEIP